MEKYPYIGHILIIDDDDRIRLLLKKYLKKEGFLVSKVSNAIEGEELLKEIKFDMIIVDRMMPGKSGVEFIKDIRKQNIEIPIIMLTAVNEIESKLEVLSEGADDYLSKPFEPKELLLRIKNILKRIDRKNADEKIMKFSNYEYNMETGILKQNDNIKKLTDLENKILQYLFKRKNEIISREELLKELNIKEERGVDVIITRIRKKLEKDIKNPEIILTIRNKGYKFIG